MLRCESWRSFVGSFVCVCLSKRFPSALRFSLRLFVEQLLLWKSDTAEAGASNTPDDSTNPEGSDVDMGLESVTNGSGERKLTKHARQRIVEQSVRVTRG